MRSRRVLPIWRAAFAAVLLCAALCLCAPGAASADVRASDIIAGETSEARGLAAGQCPNVEAPRAILVDGEGSTYFERNADEPCQIASITKVMTAVTAVDSVPLDTVIVVDEDAADVGESSASLEEGDTMPLTEALKALLWPSGNDAAVAIADTVGRMMLESEGLDASSSYDCRQRFIAAMNDKGAQLGMADSTWTNPHGLDGGPYGFDMHSTARDVAKLCAYAMQKEVIRSVTSVHGGQVQVDRNGGQVTIDLESTDELLVRYDGTIGVKTGFTDDAGYCFAGACSRDGVELYSVVLGAADPEQRFDDTQVLWDWALAHLVDYPLVSAETYVAGEGGAQLPVVAQVACTAWPDRAVAATVSDPDAHVRVFDLVGNVSCEATYEEPSGAVRAGDIVGRLDYYQHNSVIATMDLVAVQDVPAPGLIEGVMIAVTRFLGSLQGQPTALESYLTFSMPLVYDKSAPLSV